MFLIFYLVCSQTYKPDPGVWYLELPPNTPEKVTFAGLQACEAQCNADPNCVAVSIRPGINYCLKARASATRFSKIGWDSYVKIQPSPSPSPVSAIIAPTPTVVILATERPFTSPTSFTDNVPLNQPLKSNSTQSSSKTNEVAAPKHTIEVPSFLSLIDTTTTPILFTETEIPLVHPAASKATAITSPLYKPTETALLASPLKAVNFPSPLKTANLTSSPIKNATKPLNLTKIEPPTLSDSTSSTNQYKPDTTSTTIIIIALSLGFVILFAFTSLYYKFKYKQEQQQMKNETFARRSFEDTVASKETYRQSVDSSIYWDKSTTDPPEHESSVYSSEYSQYESTMNSSAAFRSHYSHCATDIPSVLSLSTDITRSMYIDIIAREPESLISIMSSNPYSEK